MSKEIYISSTPHETRLAIVEKEELSEIYYERENEYTLAGSIYNGRVTRVLPGMQSAFVDVGLERDAFLYITDFLEEEGEAADSDMAESRARGNGASRPRERDRTDRGDRDRGGRGREESREAAPSRAPETAFAEPQAADRSPEGEEEAGGEGSRTWRGRRGRRRGRGGEHQTPQVAERPTQVEAPEEFAPGEEAARVALESVHGHAATENPGYREPRPREERGREDRGRDRGGRDRDRDRGRGGRPRRDDQPAESSVALAGDAEPLILPGESLSKYRRGDGAEGTPAAASHAPRPQANLVTARPSTEFNLATAGWDGGSVLPGETLSRHRDRPAQPAPAASTDRNEGEAEAATNDVNGRNRRRDRDRRRGRPERAGQFEGSLSAAAEAGEDATPTSFSSGVVAREELAAIDAVQPGVTSQHEPEAADMPSASSIIDLGEVPAHEFMAQANETAEDLYYVPSTDVAPPAEEPGDALLNAVEQLHETVAASVEPAAPQAVEEFHEETLEYEPGEDAAASHRVDPVGPSEFRQASLVEDELNLAQVRYDEGSEIGQEGAGHEFTAVQPGGEMLSELPGEVAVPGATEDPTNPIEHETAVQSVRMGDLDGDEQPDAQLGEAGTSAAPQAFAPGDGQLEEELLDEDEGELFDVAASYGEDTEEEVLEAGAEIGSLARDRALEQMTRAELLVADDEDDFELDDEELEEDELDESEELASGDISLVEEEEAAAYETAGFDEDSERPAASTMGEFPEFAEPAEPAEGGRERGGDRGEGRRDVRRGGRDRGGRGGRDSRGMANSRSNGGRPNRHSVQNTDLPAISDLLKPGQEVLVQIAKEPIAKKGARITSHIALPGRFLVFMPTVNHVGVSRKIESDGERRRLKEILLSEKGEAAGGFIVRTAALGATEEELRSDLRFLLNLWADIKQRSESSKSPALIYHDLNLVERILRDQVTDNFSVIWVDTESEYERVLRFLQRFQPALMRRVKLYTKDTPLFEQFGISEEINKALRSKVWLKSGGSIVINQTEALVAIDINTGKYVGKTARLEDTIVKTNLDAIPEIVRQIRLRDLGGIIVIDFIDMDDRKNRARVLQALEEELKNDRAPSKVLQFNDFGLVAITRKRVKQSLERTLSTTCAICAGTGMVKSPVTVCNEIYTELHKMHKQLDKGDIMLRVNPEVVKQLKSNNAKWLQEMEEISGKTILVKSDPSLHPEQFDIH